MIAANLPCRIQNAAAELVVTPNERNVSERALKGAVLGLTTRLLLLGGLLVPMLAGLAKDLPSVSPSPSASSSASPAQLPSQAKPVDRVLVPVPKEVFDLLDQFHNA